METGVIPYADKKPGGNKAKEDLSAYMLAYPGDIVLNSMNVVVGSVGLSKYFGAVSPVYYMLRPRSSNDFVEYFDAIFHDVVFQRSLFGLGNGILYIESKTTGKLNTIRLRIPMSKLKRVLLPYPCPTEQTAIVRFLDHADRRIRRYIRAKQKLIKLLEEQKQAIIQRAVTRGLDPTVRLKPSWVEWLGHVPEHWDVVALKRACSLVRDGTHLPPSRALTGVPLLSVRNIIADEFTRRDDDSMISEPDYEQLCRSFVPHANDVLLAIVGATLGKVAVVPKMERFHIQRSVAIFRTRPEKLSHQFLAAYLRAPAFQRALWTTVAFSAQPGIYLNTLGNFAVLLPPLEEQARIVATLGGALRDLDYSIRAARKEIQHLREYRTRLIADVVTGKLDVRDAAARLPDEIDELEPLDEAEGDTDVEADVADEIDAVSQEAEA